MAHASSFAPPVANPAFSGSVSIGGGGLTSGQLLGGASALASLGAGIASIFVGLREQKRLRKRAIREAARIRRAGNKILGAQTVAFAHAGVTQQGTPQSVRNDSIAEIEREVFRSTQGFEDAGNRAVSAGVVGLALGLSDAALAVATTAIKQPGTSALFGRRAGLTAGILVASPTRVDPGFSPVVRSP